MCYDNEAQARYRALPDLNGPYLTTWPYSKTRHLPSYQLQAIKEIRLPNAWLLGESGGETLPPYRNGLKGRRDPRPRAPTSRSQAPPPAPGANLYSPSLKALRLTPLLARRSYGLRQAGHWLNAKDIQSPKMRERRLEQRRSGRQTQA